MKLLILLCSLAGAMAYHKGLAPWDPTFCCYPVPPECCPQPCPQCLDVVFIVDDSSSIASGQFASIIQFLIDFANTFTIGPNDFQTALIQFADAAELRWNLGMHMNNADLLSWIGMLTHGGGFTDTVLGINLAISDVIGSAGDRDECGNACVVITDGLSTSFPPGSTGDAAADLRAVCDEVYAIGIEFNVPTDEFQDFEAELESIAGDPSNVIPVSTFEVLQAALEDLVDEICEDFVPEQADGCCPYDNIYYYPRY